MESKLFKWQSWGGDFPAMTFYECVLVKGVGDFAPGTHFPSITLNVELGLAEFEDVTGGTHLFQLGYQIGLPAANRQPARPLYV